MEAGRAQLERGRQRGTHVQVCEWVSGGSPSSFPASNNRKKTDHGSCSDWLEQYYCHWREGGREGGSGTPSFPLIFYSIHSFRFEEHHLGAFTLFPLPTSVFIHLFAKVSTQRHTLPNKRRERRHSVPSWSVQSKPIITLPKWLGGERKAMPWHSVVVSRCPYGFSIGSMLGDCKDWASNTSHTAQLLKRYWIAQHSAMPPIANAGKGLAVFAVFAEALLVMLDCSTYMIASTTVVSLRLWLHVYAVPTILSITLMLIVWESGDSPFPLL